MLETQKRICLIYNYAQHYRLGIFKMLDRELSCDFYFGDKMDDVKKLDYSELPHFKAELNNLVFFSPIYWQKGAVPLIFKKYDCYILLGEYYCLSTWVILLLNKFFSKKTYLWTHGWYGNESLSKKIIKKIFFKLSDGIFLYGNYAKKLMIAEGFNESKLHVIYNSLNYESQICEREKLTENNIFKDYFKNDNKVLIFIGRLSKVKKLDLLLEGLKVLHEKGEKVNLVFVGKGEEEEKLKSIAETTQLSQFIWFYGATYNEHEIGNLIYNADICVSPGNVGLTAMHSLVYGTPVITHSEFQSQMPEFEAIKEGVTGSFFEINNVLSLTETIQKALLLFSNRELTRKACFEVIDSYYNPRYQLNQIAKNINMNEK